MAQVILARGGRLVIPFIEVKDGRIHYSLDGPAEASVLVLSNSLGTSLALWNAQLTAFVRHFRVLRYDSRGHGQSSVVRGPYSIDQLAHDVIELLDQLKISSVHFCGLSLGGMVGMRLATHEPARIGRLILANTAAYLGPADAWNARIEAVRRSGLASIVDSVIERWFTPRFRERSPQDVERLRKMFLTTPAEGYTACCAAIRDMDQCADLAKISSPTLVIGGRYDPATPPVGALAMAEAIRGKVYVELAAAHLSNVEVANAFNRVVLDFLRS